MKVRGLAAIDKRTVAAQHLLAWRHDLIENLDGAGTVSAAQLALVEDAVRTRLFLDHVDAFLLERSSLIVKRRRQRDRVMPLVIERIKLADHLMQVLSRIGLERKLREPLNSRITLPNGTVAPSPPRRRPLQSP